MNSTDSANESGIEIGVETRYVERESEPEQGRYVFAYTITVTNCGAATAQLLDRHWWITDGQGEVEEVEGPGVVGQQPCIPSGQAFRYTSAAVLSTPVGAMHGTYGFQRDDGSRFQVPIPAFSLCIPSLVH